jgi:hypothetical protein
VTLDERSRHQQVGEGHYASLDQVPTHALTMTVPALRAAREMICVVPESRKAEAVRKALRGPVSTACPASILRRTPHAVLYLDQDAAGQLDPKGFPKPLGSHPTSARAVPRSAQAQSRAGRIPGTGGSGDSRSYPP